MRKFIKKFNLLNHQCSVADRPNLAKKYKYKKGDNVTVWFFSDGGRLQSFYGQVFLNSTGAAGCLGVTNAQSGLSIKFPLGSPRVVHVKRMPS